MSLTRAAFLVLFAVALLASAEDVIECSGFIRVSPEFTRLAPDVKINYAKDIKILLKSPEGRVKFSTEPEPNGFFIIPVYEKAQYVLAVQGPSGWSFAPNTVQVNLNDDNVKCSADFLLKGFAIEGQIKGGERCGSGMALGGLTVTLSSKNAEDTKTVTTQTRADGSYSISGVVPGQYTLKIDGGSVIKFDKSEFGVEVSTTGITMDGSFSLGGFEISGRVQEASKKGVSGVTVQLFSDDIRSIPLCERPSSKSGVLCTAVTADNGLFAIRNLPCANYRLVPVFASDKAASASFDIFPTELRVNLDSGSYEIPEPFVVSGFTVKGRVVDADGKGLAGVSVSSAALGKSATTDANGEYKIPGVSSGKYSFVASKANFHFTSISEVSVSPQSAVVPEIAVDGYSICGKLEVAGSKVSGRTINLRGNGADLTVKTDISGQFCFDNVKSGKFTAAPETTEAELAKGLSINPRDVSVFTEPVLDITFEMIRLKISGSVKCFESCGPDATVSLISSGSDASAVEIDENGKFVFENVIPGQYRLKVNADDRCFSSDEIRIQLKSVDVTDVKFDQIGFPVEINVDRAVDVAIERANLKGEASLKKDHSLVKGVNKVCVDKKGTYIVSVKSDCFKFVNVAASESSEVNSFSYDVGKSKALTLRAVSFKIGGIVHVEDSKADAKSVSASLESSFEGKKALEVTKAGDKSFAYSYFGRLDEVVKITFQYKDFVFYPREVLAEITSTALCPEPLNDVVARPPLYLEGSVTPATEGVAITVSVVDGEVVNNTPFYTDAKGKYRAGPFADDKKYTVKASKEGYVVKATSASTFEVLKLASITVNVVSLDNEPISGVFVSVSSADGYRQSEVTNEKGSFKFLGLAPSEYYVKPLMKEFEFQPTSQAAQIASGEDKTVTIKAKRIGYSVFGSVKSLNSDAEKQLVVEATPLSADESLSKEDAQTDNDGNFRIRGLKPGVSYSIRIRGDLEKNSRVARSEPSEVTVDIPAKGADIKNVDFVVFRKISKYSISGVVDSDLESLKSVAVQLFQKEENGEKVVAEEALYPSNYFHFGGLEGNIAFAIKIKTNLTEKVFDYKIEPVDIKPLASSGSQTLTLKFDVKRRFAGAEINENNLFGFWAVAFCFLVYYFYDKIAAFVTVQIAKNKGEEVQVKKDDFAKNNDWVTGWAQKQKKNK